MPSGWIGLITRAINSRRKPLKKAASFRVAGGLSWDLCCRALPLCRNVRSFYALVGPQFFFVPFIPRTWHSSRNVPACPSDSRYRLCLPGCFSRKAGIGSSGPPEYRPNFRCSYRAGTFGEIPGHQRSDVFPARIACPCIGEEGAAEFTVHGDKRFHIRPGRRCHPSGQMPCTPSILRKLSAVTGSPTAVARS